MFTKPLSPREVFCLRYVPSEIIEIFNALIIEKTDDRMCAVISQKEVIDRIVASGLVPEGHREEVFNTRWLDICCTYKECGWDVFYDNRICEEECDLSYRFQPRDGDFIFSYDYRMARRGFL